MKRQRKEFIQSIFHLHLSRFFSLATYLSTKIPGQSFENKLNKTLKSIRYNGQNQLALKQLREMKRKSSFFELLRQTNENTEDIQSRIIELSCPIYKDEELELKGVLLVSFTSSFSIFLNSDNFEKLNKEYLFILEPSWTGYADIDILSFCEVAEDLIIQATDLDDRALISTMYPHVDVLDIGASNWVNQDKFINYNYVDKKWDLLYVANNNPVKRVYRFIEIIEEITKVHSDLKCRIVCAGWGGNSDDISLHIDSKNLQNNIFVSNGVKQNELIDLYNDSKVSVLFSLKEGSNRVLFESLSCNTPVFCVAENRGVNKSYINESTGMIAHDSCCGEAILYLVKNYKDYNAREWAVSNISPHSSTVRIKNLIENKYYDKVNSSISVKINNPEVEYLNPDQIKERKKISL